MTARRPIRPKRTLRRLLLGAVLLALTVGGLLALRASLKPNHAIDSSKLVQVTLGDVVRSVVATGKIQPRVKVELKSKASGIVERILVDCGDWVKQGQVLVELDKEELRARVREALAALEAALAAQDAARAAYERNQVEAEGPDIPFLKAALERASQLHAQGLVSRTAVEETDKAYQMALNRRAAALRNLAVTRAEIARAAAQVAQARAALERAQEDLRNATIASPMDGVVLSRNVEVGDAVSSILVLGSQAPSIMTLGDLSDVYVLGKVDQGDIGKVYVGQPARITVESFKDKKLVGQVTKIAPLGVEKDNVTTFEVRVSIKNPTGELKPNMSANAEIILEEKHQVPLVPESAVIYDRERRTFVEVPDPKAERGRRRVPVKLGISDGIHTEVLAGLKLGDTVILQ